MKVNTNVRETHFEVKWVAEMTGSQGEGRGEDVTQSCHYVMKFEAPKMELVSAVNPRGTILQKDRNTNKDKLWELV